VIALTQSRSDVICLPERELRSARPNPQAQSAAPRARDVLCGGC
jgi:hypothetical protein